MRITRYLILISILSCFFFRKIFSIEIKNETITDKLEIDKFSWLKPEAQSWNARAGWQILIQRPYIINGDKMGLFSEKNWYLTTNFSSPYTSPYYENKNSKYTVHSLQSSFIDILVYYEDKDVKRIWQSPSPARDIQLYPFNAKFDGTTYNLFLVFALKSYPFAAPKCRYGENSCDNPPPEFHYSKTLDSADFILVYNDKLNEWIDARYLADQRLQRLADSVSVDVFDIKFSKESYAQNIKSINGTLSHISKSIEEGNIDLEDVSPLAQTCYFINPLEPCYPNFKPNPGAAVPGN